LITISLQNNINLNYKKNFSTELKKNSSLNNEFKEWLCGLIDGEGHFYINKKSETVFSFRFEIHLHIDDKLLLNYICKTLGIGKVYAYGDKCTFVVSNHREVQIIIDLLTKYPLNTTKLLNFLDLKKALELYTNSTRTEDIIKEITNLKNGMNSKRTVFKMPDFHIPLITNNWLLGFVEGEGSFSVRRGSNKFELLFSISQSSKDEILMDAIKQFLENLPGTHGSDVVKKSIYKPKGVNHQPVIQLVISQTDYIKNVLIPFFSSLKWHSKKELDFNDWVIIFNLKERGHHYQEEGLRVLNAIVNQMNNSRLSTSKNTNIDRDQLLKDIAVLLNGPSNYGIIGDRKIIKSLNKLAGVGKQVIIQLEEENGNIIKTFYSILDCAKFFNVSRTLIYSRLSDNRSIIFEGKSVFIKKK